MKKTIIVIIVAYFVMCFLCLGCFVAPSPFQKYTLLLPNDSVYTAFSKYIERDSLYIKFSALDCDTQHFSIVVGKEKIRFAGNINSIDPETSECSLLYIDYFDVLDESSKGGDSMNTPIVDAIYGKRIFETEVLSKVCDWHRQIPPIFDTIVYFFYRNFKYITCLSIVVIVFLVALVVLPIKK